jgi:hypothetical protein
MACTLYASSSIISHPPRVPINKIELTPKPSLALAVRPILTTDVCVVDVASALTEGLPARYHLSKDVFVLINPSPDKA